MRKIKLIVIAKILKIIFLSRIIIKVTTLVSSLFRNCAINKRSNCGKLGTFFFKSKVATFGERGSIFFNISKFMPKEAFFKEKFLPRELTSYLGPVSLIPRALTHNFMKVVTKK